MIRRASAKRSSGTIEIPVSSLAMPITAAPCFLTSGKMRSMRSSSAVTELTSALPWYAERPASSASMIEESMQIGRSQTSVTALIAAMSIAAASSAGMPAFTSSMCAPAAACAIASERTRSILPSFISAARTLRPVGWMRSPMITKGRSPDTTTSRPRELSRVSKLAFFQSIVDQLYGMLQSLRALRSPESIADELHGHAGRHRCVRRVAVGTHVLGVLLGHRCAADRDVNLVSEPGLGQGLDVDLEHGHRGGQKGREADHVRLVLFDRGHELLGRRVHTQVEDLEPCALEHDHAEVLADVVDVALHGADDVAADRLGAGLRDERAQDDQGALHGAGGDQHLGDEEVALLKAPPDLFEGRDQGFEEDVHRVHAELQAFLGQSLHLGGVSVERVLEQLGPDFLFSAHSSSMPLTLALSHKGERKCCALLN